ncbi:MAG TPA: c-type cytochrome [Vicinamibacteria bacterium]
MLILLRRFPAAGLLLAGLGVTAFAVLVSSLAAPVSYDKEASAKGRLTYERYCVSCHGKTARGDGPLAKDLRVPVPDLTLAAKRAGGTYPSDRVFGIISRGSVVRGHGTDDMPAWGSAFNRTEGTEAAVDEAIRNLVTYLGSVQRLQ